VALCGGAAEGDGGPWGTSISSLEMHTVIPQQGNVREMGDRKAVENCEAGKGAQPLLLPVPELQPGAEAQEDSGAEFHWDTKQRDTHMRAGWGNKSRLKRVRKKVLDVLRSPAQRLQFYLCQLRAKDAATPIANKSACRARHSMACLAVQLGQHSSPGAVVCTRWHRVPREGVDAPSLETSKVRLDRALST